MEVKGKALLMAGKLEYPPDVRAKLARMMTDYDGKEVLVTITTDIHNRSVDQNSFFHGCIVRAMMRVLQIHGTKNSENYEYVKEVYLKKPYLTVNAGQDDEYIRSTSDLNSGEFWDFCIWCLQLLSHFGGELNDKEQDEFKRIVSQYHLEAKIDQAMA